MQKTIKNKGMSCRASMKEETLLEQLNFTNIPIDYSWSFADKTIKDTSYITHGYYTYPAKFIPQLVSRLIMEYSKGNDIVVDPFAGCGITVVEAIINNRVCIATDINEIAFLVSKVKTTPIQHSHLLETLNEIELQSYRYSTKDIQSIIPQNERIDYWFLPEQKEKIASIFIQIEGIKNDDIRNFF